MSVVLHEGQVDATGVLVGRARGRDERACEEQVAACRAWIRQHGQRARRVLRPGRDLFARNSYSYKHDVEDWTDGSRRPMPLVAARGEPWSGGPLYIANGAFIVAAIREGYRAVQDAEGSPNAWFDLDVRSADQRAWSALKEYDRSDAAAWRHRVESPRPRGLAPEYEWSGNVVRLRDEIYPVVWVADEGEALRVLCCPECEADHTLDATSLGRPSRMPCDEDAELDTYLPLAIETPAPRPTTLGFNDWLREQFRRDDPVGDLARDVIEVGAYGVADFSMPPIEGRSEIEAWVRSYGERNHGRVGKAASQAFWEWSRCRAIAPRTQVVYFVQRIDGGAIKIGTTSDLPKRLGQLQTGSDVPLALLATIPGDESIERELHARFAGDRRRGEWFCPSPALLAYIGEVWK